MAFPSQTGSKADTLAEAWEGARQRASMVKAQAQAQRSAAGSSMPGGSILGFATFLADMRADLLRYSAVPGLAAYAQAQVNDPALDVAGEFTAMVNTITATRDWIIANFPKDGSGFILAQTFAATGKQVDRTFTTGSLAGYRTVLDALIAAID